MRAKYDKETIIAQGAELFRKKGYNFVGINEILTTCGIPKGSFYNFFATKEDFGTQVVSWYGERQRRFITDMLKPSNGSPLERLKGFYQHLIDANDADGLNAGCLVNNISIELGGLNPQLGTEAHTQFQSWIDIIAKTIEEGQNQGEIRQDLRPVELAEHLHTGIYGAFALMKTQRSRAPLDRWFKLAFAFVSA